MRFNFRLEDIKYANLLYKDLDDKFCKESITIKTLGEEIKANCRIKDDLRIKSKQDVILSLVCGDGLYIIKTKIKSVEKDEPYIFFEFEKVDSIEHHQKREYFRVPVLYECNFIARVGDEMREITAKTFDLSANGVALYMQNYVDYKNITNISLNIEQAEIKIVVKYVRSIKLDNGYKVSYYFEKIANSDRDFISQICIKKQIEERRNSLR